MTNLSPFGPMRSVASPVAGDLGPLVRTFAPAPFRLRARDWLSVVLAWLLGAVAIRFLASERTPGLVGLAPYLLAIAAFVALNAYRTRSGPHVELRTGGFVYRRAGAEVVARFDDVESIAGMTLRTIQTQTGRTTEAHVFDLALRDGRGVHLDSDLSGVAELIRLLDVRIGPTLLECALRDVQNLVGVRFGDLWIGPPGLRRADGATMAWDDVGTVRLEGRWLRIRQRGYATDWLERNRQDIPNEPLLSTLLRQRIPAAFGVGDDITS